jgi:hypothetical protein
MMSTLWKSAGQAMLIGAIAIVGGGCGSEKAEPAKAQAAEVQLAARPATHDHSSWWCDEHGVPEEMCGQCNAKFAAECKKKGDWCAVHDRPASQCFIHHPELKEKFAALYRAKYGKEPPPVEEENGKTESKK